MSVVGAQRRISARVVQGAGCTERGLYRLRWCAAVQQAAKVYTCTSTTAAKVYTVRPFALRIVPVFLSLSDVRWLLMYKILDWSTLNV